MTLWYRMGDIFTFPAGTANTTTTGVLTDSSGFTLPIGSVPHNLTYYERAGQAGWVTATSRPSLSQLHSELGVSDNGCVHFNFKQTVFGVSASPQSQPGASFAGGVNGLATFENLGGGGSQPVGFNMQTFTCFFKIDNDAPTSNGGFIVGNQEVVIGTGGGGWGLTHGQTSGIDYLTFSISDSVHSMSMTSTSVTRDEWHHVAVTRDSSTSPATWKLWLDGVSVATTTHAYFDHGYFGSCLALYIANDGVGGARDNYFKGYIDEIATYSTLLTAEQILSIAVAGGIGTATSPSTPFNVYLNGA